MCTDSELGRKPLRNGESVLETYFLALVYLLSILSVVVIALLSWDLFTPRNVALGAAVSALVSGWLLRNRSFGGRLMWAEWSLLAIAVLTVSFRSNPAAYLNGGQDPGVYSAMAIHFARTGSLRLSDSLLPVLAGNDEIRSYYLKRSMHRLREKRPGTWIGNMLPGAYLSNLEKNEWDFQFYALHPAWLAIGNWLFGLQAQSWILVLFSTLSVMSAYFITRRITGGYAPGLCAAVLLAINPGHAYFATVPVSETVAGFFFLATIYLLLDKRFLGFLAPLTALFLTRITGFITAPLLMVALGWMALRRRDPRPLWAGFGVLSLYAMSFYWGLAFSPHYSFDIYKSKLGIHRGALEYAGFVFLGIGAVWAAVGYLVTRQRQRFLAGFKWVSRHRYRVSGCIVIILIATCAYRGYVFAFTDHYQQHRWYSGLWKMAGHGWSSLSYLSANTLRLLLSSVGTLGFVLGVVVVGASACRRSALAPIAILAVGFSFALLVGQLTTPTTYYFARYLVSELVPLACICAVVALERIRGSLSSCRSLVLPLYGACVLASVWPALTGRMSATEGKGLSLAVECINELTGPQSVLLIDRHKLALGSYSYATPLRLGFGKRVYTVAFKDFAAEPRKLDALVAFFESKNAEVFLLSSNPEWKGRSQLTNVLTLPISQERLIARRRLPTRFTRRDRTVRIFARRAVERMPLACHQKIT